ncbi:helix-turn-helix domain-containing protein [Rudanella paleaurantiibacter]|uniref:Helix-turn-helix domain-containing protein n=1 Tax=Rudanella paleaurantiibacter TaxID=2614655 RepID=A0A7J5U1D9_9BACT|nr:helix-turn-helix transcriptional regulator [Rudanella paleaurantiibacter]KAB7731437.1 helix-turn-helix domain-containing protein [Rudanella paleaurantiibacter]
MQLNDNIRHYCKDKGYTQECLAEHLHMSQSNWSRTLQKPIPDSLLLQIAKALATRPDELKNYHLPVTSTENELLHTELRHKDELIGLQQKQIEHLQEQNRLLHARLADCLRGGGRTIGSSHNAP